MADEKRADDSVRLRKFIDVVVEDRLSFTLFRGAIGDISATGMRVISDQYLPKGTDGDYSAVSWLIHRTGIIRGAAVGHSAWAKRVATHPRILAALAAGQVPESAGRLICLWTGKLPPEYRDTADEQLLAA